MNHPCWSDLRSRQCHISSTKKDKSSIRHSSLPIKTNINPVITFNLTMLSCSSYVWAFNFTFGNECGLGWDSKFVLNNESISVDLPRPVSPMQRMLNTNPFWTLLLTNWSGMLSNPTWPDSFKVRGSSCWKKNRTGNVYYLYALGWDLINKK